MQYNCMQTGQIESAGVSGHMFYVRVNLTFADLTLAYSTAKSFPPHLQISKSYTLSRSFIKYNCCAINLPVIQNPSRQQSLSIMQQQKNRMNQSIINLAIMYSKILFFDHDSLWFQ